MQLFIRRYRRGIEYLLRYLFIEWPRGLDFSIRNKTLGVRTSGNHGYALTSKRALKNMLRHIPYQGKALIDVGSGKGGVICFAYELGASTCEGIEVEEHLHRIAVQNINRLGYSPQVRSTLVDARLFDRYVDFDIFFLFNPFDDDIYEEVVQQICDQTAKDQGPHRQRYVICYGAANLTALSRASALSLIVEEECPYRGNMYRIYGLGAGASAPAQ